MLRFQSHWPWRSRCWTTLMTYPTYCWENRELLHKYYVEIAKERMHLNDYHLIEHHKALLPTLENDKDDESKIDVGVDVDKEDWRVELLFRYYMLFLLSQIITLAKILLTPRNTNQNTDRQVPVWYINTITGQAANKNDTALVLYIIWVGLCISLWARSQKFGNHLLQVKCLLFVHNNLRTDQFDTPN